MRLAGEMNFPWLMSNVKSAATGRLLAEGEEKCIINWQGRKVSDEVPDIPYLLISSFPYKDWNDWIGRDGVDRDSWNIRLQ